MSIQTQTAVKRALLQIKTSDRNVKHRFRTHWETIHPRAFKKTTLLAMCKSLEINAPIRLRKGDVFERLIKGLLSRMQMQMQMRGGAEKKCFDAAGIQSDCFGEYQLPTYTKHSVAVAVHPRSTQDPRLYDAKQPHLFDFDEHRFMFGQLKSVNTHILELIDLLDVPIYIVYDCADDMFRNLYLNDDIILDDLTSFAAYVDTLFPYTLSEHDTEIKRLFTSYILCKCVESYAIEQFPKGAHADNDLLHADGVFALNYVFASLLHKEFAATDPIALKGGAPSSLDSIFATKHFKNAFACFGCMQSHVTNDSPQESSRKQWWRKSSRSIAPEPAVVVRVHVSAPVPVPVPVPVPPSILPMHPANFIVQTNLEMICGFVAVLTMISKSDQLVNFFSKTLSEEGDKLVQCSQSDNLQEKKVYLTNRLKNLEYILSNLKTTHLLSVESKVMTFFGLQKNQSIAAIKNQINDMKKIIKNTNREQLQQFIDMAIAKNAMLTKYINVLFNMSRNVDTILSDDFDSPTSVRFNSFRLLDQLQSLCPESLQWCPYGASTQIQYAYAMNLFVEAGLNASDITYACTTKKASGATATATDHDHDGAFIMRANSSTNANLYVHFIREPVSGLGPSIYSRTTVWNQPFQNVGKAPYDDMRYGGFTFTLGGFVFASSPKDGSGHAISGFRHKKTQYLYNGYPSSTNPLLPCKPIAINWDEMFSGTPYYIRYFECGMHAAGDLEFKYPFRSYFGLGIVSKDKATVATHITVESKITTLDANMYTDYVDSYKVDATEQIYQIVNNGKTKSEQLDMIHDLLKASQSIARTRNLYVITIDWDILELKDFIKILLYKLLYYSHVVSSGLVYKIDMFTETKTYAKSFFDNVHTHVKTFATYDWVVDIIIFVTAKLYAESENDFSKEENYYERRADNMNFKIYRIFRAVNSMYLPIGNVDQLFKIMNDADADADRNDIENWIYKTTCAHATTPDFLSAYDCSSSSDMNKAIARMNTLAAETFEQVVKDVGAKLKSSRTFPFLRNIRVL